MTPWPIGLGVVPSSFGPYSRPPSRFSKRLTTGTRNGRAAGSGTAPRANDWKRSAA